MVHDVGHFTFRDSHFQEEVGDITADEVRSAKIKVSKSASLSWTNSSHWWSSRQKVNK